MSGWGRLAVCLFPLAAGALAVIVLAAVPHRGSRNANSCLPLHAPVPADARHALAAYAGRIEYSLDRSSDGSREQLWSDPVTGDNRQLSRDADGSREQFASMERGRWETTYWVIYDDRSYTVDRARVSKLPGLLSHLGVGPQRNAAALEAQLNRDLVLHGSAVVLGREIVEGRTLLHLRQIVPAQKLPPLQPKLPTGLKLPARFRAQTLPSYRIDTWVDPLTYITLRRRVTSQAETTVTVSRWLPRTPATIALTRVVIPAGFRREIPDQAGTQFSAITTIKITKKHACA